MARHIVISNGDDALTAPIVAYLEQNYGIEPADIKRVSLVSEVGDVQLLTVTLMIKAPEFTKRDVDPLGRGVGGDAGQPEAPLPWHVGRSEVSCNCEGCRADRAYEGDA